MGNKICDNACVGILAWDGRGRLLVIERKTYNPGFAPPAGHLDGLDPIAAARKELGEEVGLIADALQERFQMTLPNPCKRDGGSHHAWTVVEVTQWHGEVKPSDREAKQAIWADRAQLRMWAERLKDFAREKGISLKHWNGLPQLVKETNESEEWKQAPGLEPPYFFLLKKLGIL